MVNRFAHLVGSIPYNNEKTAMEKTIDIIGKNLKSLPDGEIGRKTARHKTGERLGWIQWVIERFENNPAFTLVTQPRYDSVTGLWADYKSMVRYKLNVKPRDLYQYLDFGYIDYFNENYSLFKKLRKEHHAKDLVYQFGIPGTLALSFFSIGFIQGLRNRSIFEDRQAYEANRIHEAAGDDVLFQIEVPIELGLVIKAPGFLKLLVRRWAVKTIISLVNKMDADSKIGIHLCLGDLNNVPFSKITDVGSLVDFSNEIIRQWPRERPLDFIHYPMAMGNIPPSTDAAYYVPLKELHLPPETRFIAGFIHERLNDSQLADILALTEDLLGRTVDVSSSCGLGRRSEDVADLLLRKTAKLLKRAS